VRWFRFLRRSQRDGECAQEIESYLEIETDDNITRGMAPVDARAAAVRKFGNPTRIREDVYHMNTISPLDSLWQDLRYGTRVLRRDKAFALAAIVSLALGIGANTAIFQLLDTVRLRTLPVAAPEELVEVRIPPGSRTGAFQGRRPMATYAQWQQLQQHQQAFSGMLAWSARRMNTAPAGEVRFVDSLWVSGDFFTVLGVRPAIGRVFTAADDVRGCAAPGAVLSHAFWQREYGGRPDALGKRVLLDGQSFDVIGVAPPSFFGVDVGRTFDVAIPLCAEDLYAQGASRFDRNDAWWLAIFGRLASGWTLERARAHLDAISPGIFEATLPATYLSDEASQYRAFRWTANPAASGVSGLRADFSEPLVLLMAITGLVLVIACANLANLLLARASVREREIALRLAIGAARRRVVRQLLVESVLLAAAGAVVGALLAAILSRVLVSMLAGGYVSLFVDLSWNWRMFAFTCGVSLLACLLFGLVPAFRATALAPGAALRTGGRGMTASRERFGLRRVLVATQVALSLVLLVGALLFTRTFYNLVGQPVGFDTNGVVIAVVNHPLLPHEGEAAQAARRELRARVAGVPDVAVVAQADVVPLGNTGLWNETVRVYGASEMTPEDRVADFNRVSAEYFEVLGLPLSTGRNFAETDSLNAPTVAIVSQKFVDRFVPDRQPLGRRIFVDMANQPPLVYQIVGVVPDTKISDLREDSGPLVYVPASQEQEPGRIVQFVLRPRGRADTAIPGVARAIADWNPALNVEFRILDETIRNSLVRERLMAALSSAFGVLAALLAAIGLYGVMSYTVARRANEIGIRIAMGAERADVLRMVLREAAILIAVGVVVGAGLAVAAANSARSLLFGLQPNDPATIGGAILLLALIGLISGYIPALRASRLDPATALRDE
jgi:putative ABC transport system permease protein